MRVSTRPGPFQDQAGRKSISSNWLPGAGVDPVPFCRHRASIKVADRCAIEEPLGRNTDQGRSFSSGLSVDADSHVTTPHGLSWMCGSGGAV